MKNKNRSLITVVVTALALAANLSGCAQGGCNYTISNTAGETFGTCLEQLSTSSALSTQGLKDFCVAQSGTYNAAACDSNTDIARCTMPSRETRDSEGNTISYTHRHHFYAPLTVEQARAACASVGGSFSPVTR
jgi:hypothetical protein